MNHVPITFLCPNGTSGVQGWHTIFREFAANGARHLVFADFMISEIMHDPKVADQLRREIELDGLTFVDSHAPFGKFVDLHIPEFREQMILRQKLAINIAADMGVDTITIHTGADVHFPDVPPQTLFDNTCDALDKILPLAEKRGIVVCIENLCVRNCMPDVLLNIKAKFPTDFLGFCYDSGHANLLAKGASIPDNAIMHNWATAHAGTPEWDDKILEKMSPHVVSCHLHDNDGSDDQHAPLCKGTVNWKHIIEQLKQCKRLRSAQCEASLELFDTTIAEICRNMLRTVEKY